MNAGQRFVSSALILFLCSSFFVAKNAWAEAASFDSVGDSYVQSASPNRNNGASAFMDLNNVRDGVVKFDVSTIPAGSTITSATLTLTAADVGGASAVKNYGVHRIMAAWDEGTVTWNTPGSDPGTHFAVSATDMTAITDTGSYTWDVTADVAAFVAGSVSNEGWRIIWDSNDSGTNRQVDFGTKEDATPSNRPILSVTYTSPSSSSGMAAPPAKSRADLFPDDIKVSILPEICTTDRNVRLLVHAHNASEAKISNLADLSDTDWQPYEAGVDRFEVMDWALTPGDGEKTVYIRFKSPTSLESDTIEATVRVDAASLCQFDIGDRLIADPKGNIHSTESNPACLSDFAHAAAEPYIFMKDGRMRGWRDGYALVTRLSDTETRYAFEDGNDGSFDDAIVRVERTGSRLRIIVDRVQTTTIAGVSLRIEAADRGTVANEPVWARGDVLTSKPFDLESYPELCDADLLVHPHPGDLFRSSFSDIYYLGHDLKRHAFPNSEVFKSWYSENPTVLIVPSYLLSSISMGDPVTLKPGTLVRIVGGFMLHVVDIGRTLRQIVPQPLVTLLYGHAWTTLITYLDPSLLTGYALGYPITSERDPLVTLIGSASSSIKDLWPVAKDMEPTFAHSQQVLDGRIDMDDVPYHIGDVDIRFRILDATGHALTAEDLNLAQTHRIFLIIVREDLSGYQHLRPEEHDGVWSAKGHFNEEGHYYAFVDVAPEGESPIVLRAAFPVGNNPLDSTSYPVPDPSSAANDNPYRLELVTAHPPIGRETLLAFRLTKDGKPFTDIEPYLETYGHLVILKQDDLNIYLHAHPLDRRAPSEGLITFLARFPSPGRYTLFVVVNAGGTHRAFPITIDASDARTDDSN